MAQDLLAAVAWQGSFKRLWLLVVIDLAPLRDPGRCIIPQRRTNGLSEARECGSHWWQHWHSCRSLLETAGLAKAVPFSSVAPLRP